MEIKFTASDVWLLLSVARAEGEAQSPHHGRSQPPRMDGASLPSIYAWGDAINHAMFTPQELRRGFAKLLAAGYLVDYDGRFGLTVAGADLLARAGYPTTPELSVWRRLESLLEATGDTASAVGFDDPAWPYPSISDAVAREAEAEYRRAAEARMRRWRGEQ